MRYRYLTIQSFKNLLFINSNIVISQRFEVKRKFKNEGIWEEWDPIFREDTGIYSTLYGDPHCYDVVINGFYVTSECGKDHRSVPSTRQHLKIRVELES